MSTVCNQCQNTFVDSPDDKAMRLKLAPVIAGKTQELPEPTDCPDCRQQRRMAQGNQMHLYKRTCDFTGAAMISNYHPNSPYKVYKQEVWWSDKWDAESYGRDIDFSKNFFDQYRELLLAVPRYSLHTTYEYDENSEYTNYCTKNKDCYMIFDSDLDRDCSYSYSVNRSENCMDCFRIGKSQLCYECIDSVECYGSSYLQDCQNCSDSMFLKNCIGCKNCIMCSNLRNKEYWIENKQVTKEQFQQVRAMLSQRSQFEAARKRFQELKLQYPQKFMHGVQNEDVLGDYLTNCKSAKHCFDSRDLWDCRYNYQGWMSTKDAMDVQQIGDIERAYESCFCGVESQGLYFCSHSFYDHDLYYCTHCFHCSDCFGCVGLKRKKYCIFNKQYTKEQYEKIVPKLIEHMRTTKEWGRFFPVEIASFAYNETVAQDYYPMEKEIVIKNGWNWRDEDTKEQTPATYQLPQSITDVPDTVTSEVLCCATCQKNYRLIKQEVAFLRSQNLPPPTECFFCRHKARMALRNKRTLHDRSCAKCKKAITTTYGPDQPEKIFCEDCYLEAVY